MRCAVALARTAPLVRARCATYRCAARSVSMLGAGAGVLDAREALRDVLTPLKYLAMAGTEEGTFIAILISLLTFGVAVAVGKLAADPIAAGDPVDRPRKMVGGLPLGENFVFMTGLKPSDAAIWDRGGEGPEPSRHPALLSRERRGLSAGVWFELAVCMALDVAGVVSDDLGDVVFGGASALAVETLFHWRELTALAFWEELLPYTDALPTATLTWILVVLGRRPDRSPTRRSVADEASAQHARAQRPPVSDLATYAPAEPHLQPGRAPWLD